MVFSMLSVKRSLSFLLPLLLCGCAVKPLSDGELALVHNEIIVEGGEDIDSHAMLDHVAQKPTRRSFSFKKTKPLLLQELKGTSGTVLPGALQWDFIAPEGNPKFPGLEALYPSTP